MVLAESYSAAIRATDALKVEWTPGETIHTSERDIQDRGRQLISNKEGGVYIFNDDGVDRAFSGAHLVMDQEYTCASVLHYQLEPTNALAFQKDGVYEIHAGNQWQSLILPTLAKALDVPESKVILRSYLLLSLIHI